ncbi:MAG: glycoside hydrolase 100 family protein [Chloroflexota bacterium]
MKKSLYVPVEEAKRAALDVLLHNSRGPYHGLPRTAGWGYPEPYTRDLMIASLGILASGNEQLIASLRKTLLTLAKNQSTHGHIPSLVHDPEDKGASDTTPLFLLSLALYRHVTGENNFLEESSFKALNWMEYQSPDDQIMVGQLPTSDWRDEQWVLGYGLYVNTIVYAYLRLYGYDEKASILQGMMSKFAILGDTRHRHVHEGLVVPHKPYYALWSYKVYRSERFDLLGNSLAILTGIASPTRAKSLVLWIEKECEALKTKGELVLDIPPNLFPYILPEDPDWRPRYERYNKPGEYHNGGIWPFICGFYIVAAVAAGLPRLAEKLLETLTNVVQFSRDKNLRFGFNEWIRAQDGIPMGQDWQTWSAAMYLYAATCVEKESTLFFDNMRKKIKQEKGPC